MRVIHLTSVHAWNDTRVFNKMCCFLASMGMDVHLVVPRNTPSMNPEVINGVTVHPIPITTNRLERIIKTSPKVFDVGAGLNGDIYHFHDPEGMLSALRWQERLGRPFVYDVHENYRLDIYGKEWIPSFLRGLVSSRFARKEDDVVMRLAGVVAATESIAELFTRNQNVEVIRNLAILDELLPTEKTEEKSNCFAYVGLISKIRAIREMVVAVAATRNPARLLLAGSFANRHLHEECQALPGWKRVEELGFIDRKGVKELMAASLAGLVLIHPLPQYMSALPIKMFEYMSTGLPVIASDFPIWRNIIERNSCGLLVDPLDPKAIANAMDYFLENPDEARAMGKRGRETVEREYNWECEFEKLPAFYEKLTATYR